MVHWLALACPSCAVGVTVRQEVFGPALVPNVATVALPFALVTVVALCAERIRRLR
jgi:hypothetical protein